MEGNSLKTIENLCKIFETRIKLDKEKHIDTPFDVLNNYEKYAKKIDDIHNEKFEKEIKKLITPENTLEKEETRLKKLIELLNKRINEREELENKFYKTTGNYIGNLQLIVSDSEFENKKARLDAITRYLDTTNEIETINESIEKLRTSLSEEVTKEDEYKKKNKIIEDELYVNFKEIIENNDYFSSINEDDISSELDDILDKVNENKETLDVTRDSVSSLVSIGNEEDYSIYIEEAEKNYYLWKNRELLLEIYKIVINLEEEFSPIYEKRIELNKIIKNRKNIINSLSYEVQDELSDFEKIIESDLEILKSEKEVLENITNYNNRITFKEERLSELKVINNSDEILSILREYNLIDTYDNTEIEETKEEFEEIEERIEESEEIEERIEESEETDEEIPEKESLIKEFYDPYRIVEIKDYPKTLNIGLAKLKGESVRQKVNKKLNPEIEEVTFEKINNEIKPIIPEMIPIESVEVHSEAKAEEDIPVWKVPEKSKEEVVMWELPKIEPDKNEIPVWNNENKAIEELPKEEVGFPESPFWTPVDNIKPSNIDFPSINIPINATNINSNDFEFPEINN